MKHKFNLHFIIIALLSAVSVCSCQKVPIPEDDSKDGSQEASQRDSTTTTPHTVQPWVSPGVIGLEF